MTLSRARASLGNCAPRCTPPFSSSYRSGIVVRAPQRGRPVVHRHFSSPAVFRTPGGRSGGPAAERASTFCDFGLRRLGVFALAPSIPGGSIDRQRSTMSRFIKWLLLQQDQSSVSYSRFGMPGEETDDRPRPTTIFVPKFEENHRDFMLCGKIHCEKAASCSAIFGLSMVIIIFISSFFEFDWYDHRRGVDIMALLGLLVYLFLGIMLHYYVILGIKRQAAYFLLPFIVGYLAVIASGFLLVLTLIAHLIIHTNSSGRSYDGLNAPKKTVFLLFVVSLIVVAVQCFMLCAVVKCRYYLSRKEIHTTTMRVAQKSVSQNPDMRIMTLGKSGQQEEVRIPIPTPLSNGVPSEPPAPAPAANSVTSFANPVATVDDHHTSVLNSADSAFGNSGATPDVRVLSTKINNGFDNPAHNPNA
uniref:MARVEL domain-containing protein n=1 Tax=Steinernema glaseri TaxID=37863 RepID=A0A1I8AIR5_9BILA